MTFSAQLIKSAQSDPSDWKNDKVKTIEFFGKPRSFQIDSKKLFIRGKIGSVTITVYPGERKFMLKPGDTLCLEIPESESKEEHLILMEPGDSSSQVDVKTN